MMKNLGSGRLSSNAALSRSFDGNTRVFLTAAREQPRSTPLDLEDECDDDVRSPCSSRGSSRCSSLCSHDSRSITPFDIPPPMSVRRSRYTPGLESPRSSCLSIWERKALVSRTQSSRGVNEEQFQQRLSRVHERNADPYVEAVIHRAERQLERTMESRQSSLYIEEKRRSDIFFRYKNLTMLRNVDKFLARANLWMTILTAHVFLTGVFHEKKVRAALSVLRRLLGPVVRRLVFLRRRHRDRAELTQTMLPQIPYPSPEIIQSMQGSFFTGWPSPLLDRLVKGSQPTYMKKGSYLMHEGDAGRSMYMITLGAVSILFKKKNRNKSRGAANCTCPFPPLPAPCYVGEFALVCREPRSASIVCETDIGFYTISPEGFEEVVRLLSSEVTSQLREATDERRRQNLKKLFPLKMDVLRKFSYFEMFSQEALLQIIDQVDPIVLHDGDYLFRKGETETSVHFIADGVATVIEDNGLSHRIRKGACIGMFDCACAVNEKKNHSVVSINYCDIWRLPRDLLMDIGLTEPLALLHCRQQAKEERGAAMRKESRLPFFLRYDPYLSFCFLPVHILRFYEISRPQVFLPGDHITIMGQEMKAMVFIVSGTVDLSVVNADGKEEVFRLTMERRTATNKPSSQSEFIWGAGGHTYAIGAYEIAAMLDKYCCTATSYGLTEAFIVDLHEVFAMVPQELLSILQRNIRGRDVVTKAYKERNFSILQSNSLFSFAHSYRCIRERLKKERNGEVM